MPDWTKLREGNRVRLIRVPETDLLQRESEIENSCDMAGWTADTLERIISESPVVVIDRIDEQGAPWFEVELTSADGEIEYHLLTITDNDSWTYEN